MRDIEGECHCGSIKHRTSTRATSNASKDGTCMDTSTSQASEQATAFGGQVSVWGDLGGSGSLSLSGGQLSLAGGSC